MQHFDKDLMLSYVPVRNNYATSASGPLHHCKFFTLIELLVCVVIIAILVAMLLPALARAKYQARHALCTNNQKQLAASLINYASDNGSYYPVPPRWNWVRIEDYPIPVRSSSWVIGLEGNDGNYASNSWAEYVDGPFGNWKDLTVRANGIAVCPQGIQEVPWKADDSDDDSFKGDKAHYSFFPYLKLLGSASERRRYAKRRVGQPLTPNSSDGTTFSDAPLVSDITRRVRGIENPPSGFGGGVGKQAFSTNHIYGGDRHECRNTSGDIHFSGAPVYWGTITGKGEANFGMEDGSVHRFGGLSWYTYESLTYTWPSCSMGDTPQIPRELAD